MFMPIICSIHDPSRHFDIPGHGVYAFDFDRERKLSGWHRWTQNGPNTFSHDSGTIQATFTITPATTSNRTAKPKRAKRQ